MDQLIKMNFRLFPLLLTVVLLLFGLNAGAKTPSAIEGNPDNTAKTTGGAENVTVTVKHTDAGIEVITPKGRYVLLKNDHAWEYLKSEQSPAEKSAVIGVRNIKQLRNACDTGFLLTKYLSFMIKSLVPRFSAYTREQVKFDTLPTSFDSIRPTDSQYRKIRTIGISCPDILYIKCMAVIVAPWGHLQNSIWSRVNA